MSGIIDSATSEAPKSIQHLQGLLAQDLKVKVAGEILSNSWAAAVYRYNVYDAIGVDGEQILALLAVTFVDIL